MSDRFPGLGQPLQRYPRKEQRPITKRTRITIHAQGPRSLNLRSPQGYLASGPGDAPDGFTTASTSRDEWIIYWALSKIFNAPVDPRDGPYNGDEVGGTWTFQSSFRTGPVGGARIDFVVFLAWENVAIRVQSERFHVFADPEIQAYDRVQAISLGDQFRVEDVYSQDFIQDRSGQAAIVEVKRILAGGDTINPGTAGVAVRTKFDRL